MCADVAKALDYGPQVIKISSKRQITIPSKIYKEAQFGEYAIASWEGNSLKIQPFEMPEAAELDEETSVYLLARLMDKGLEGADLQRRFNELVPLMSELNKRIEASESSIESGEVVSFEEGMSQIERDYVL